MLARKTWCSFDDIGDSKSSIWLKLSLCSPSWNLLFFLDSNWVTGFVQSKSINWPSSAIDYCDVPLNMYVTLSLEQCSSWAHGTISSTWFIFVLEGPPPSTKSIRLILFKSVRLQHQAATRLIIDLVWYQSPVTIVSFACYPSLVEKYHGTYVKLEWHLVFFRQVRSGGDLHTSMSMVQGGLHMLGFFCCPK